MLAGFNIALILFVWCILCKVATLNEEIKRISAAMEIVNGELTRRADIMERLVADLERSR